MYTYVCKKYWLEHTWGAVLWSHMKWGCFAENMRKLQKIMCCINPHFTLVNYKSCQAYSLVSRCKKASFGTRSPLPAPLPTHTYRVRVIRAKKFRICAALNPHFMLVNYTGAAGDLPGEIPRKIGPRGRKIRPLDLWPWSEKLHFVIPGRLRTFGSEPGRTCATDTF